MKKLKVLLLTVLFPALAFSQVELVPFAGYFFGGSINYVQGKLKIPNSVDYGISVLVPVQPLVDVELNYTRSDQVTGTFSPYAGYPTYEFDEFLVVTNYFQVGGISKFYNGSTDAVAQPFGSFSLGATWFDVSKAPNSIYENSLYEDVWRFSVALGLGVKLMFSERVGIMLRGRLLMPLTFAGGGLYFGTGGSGVTLNSWVAPLQGDFNGGIIIKLGG